MIPDEIIKPVTYGFYGYYGISLKWVEITRYSESARASAQSAPSVQ